MNNQPRHLLACAVLALGASSSQASIVFSFQQSGANVVMTSSGTLDTTKLVTASVAGWGGTGIEENGNHDILGGTSVGAVSASFGFHAGTDFSQWASANGPWTASNFSVNTITGTTGFTTYIRPSSIQLPGIGVEAGDIIGGLWTPDQSWTWNNQTLAGLNMIVGTYTVADAVNGESITIRVGPAAVAVPEPGSLALAGLALALVGLARRKQQ